MMVASLLLACHTAYVVACRRQRCLHNKTITRVVLFPCPKVCHFRVFSCVIWAGEMKGYRFLHLISPTTLREGSSQWKW